MSFVKLDLAMVDGEHLSFLDFVRLQLRLRDWSGYRPESKDLLIFMVSLWYILILWCGN